MAKILIASPFVSYKNIADLVETLREEHDVKAEDLLCGGATLQEASLGYGCVVVDQVYTYCSAGTSHPEMRAIYGFKPVAIHIKALNPELLVAMLCRHPGNYRDLDGISAFGRDQIDQLFDYIVTELSK